MKIGNTWFDVEAINKMTFDEFTRLFKKIINTDLQTTYETLTGKKVDNNNVIENETKRTLRKGKKV